MGTRTRTTLAEGIYQDAHGITVLARLGSKPNILEAKARFPLVDNDGIPYSRRNNVELVKCRFQLLEDLRLQRARAGGEAGSLGAAIDAWKIEFPLNIRADGTPEINDKRGNDHYLIAHWRTSPLAAAPVDAIKRSQIRKQLNAWTEGGSAPTTVAHRKRILTDLLRWSLEVDDDDDITLPTEGIENPPPRKPKARGIPMPILSRILATMPDRGRPTGQGKGTRPTVSETKIRCGVMGWTGLSHMSLQRLERRLVNFRDGKMFYPDRHKGAGADGVWVALLPPALEFLRAFDRAGLWGKSWSRSSMHGTWRRAVKNTRKALAAAAAQTDDLERAADAKIMLEQFDESVAPNCYPYDTRHSFLSDVYRQYGDPYALKAIGQHADLKMGERYTKAVVPEKVASAIDAMRAKWFPEAPKPAATVREFRVVQSTK